MNSDNDSHETAATTCKDFLAQLGPIDKLLGSVSYSDIDSGGDNCKSQQQQQQQQPIRASARVFKKMKFDQNVATSNNNITTSTTVSSSTTTTTTITIPNTDTINNCNSNNNNNNINNNGNNSNIGLTIDKRDDDKQELGTTTTTTTTKSEIKKTVNTQWLSEEKNMFFEALNEHGKDFENIHMYMLTRLKKKGLPDELIKTKHQIRHFYYKTASSFLRYLKISDKVPKTAQELYALINYGELWRKIGSVSKKNWPKLNELINNGSVALRIKGKTIRLKTPMCRALRRLNQLDEKYDDLKLPTRVLVELRPKNMSAFLNVQSMAQNPRIKMAISLQKRLSSLISCISARWKTTDAQIYDKAVIATNSTTNNYVPDPKTIEKNSLLLTKLLRVQPIDNATIELPSIDISEYFNGQSICLNAFEARKVVKKTKKIDSNVVKKDMMIEKHDIDNKSPIKSSTTTTTTTIIDDDFNNDNKITVDKVVDDAVNIILSLKHDNYGGDDNNDNKHNDVITIGDDNDDDDDEDDDDDVVVDDVDEDDDDDADDDNNNNNNNNNYDDIIIINNNNIKNNNNNNNNKEEEKLKKIEEVRQGWTLENCGSLTIGELYLMFGSGSKLILEYTWDDLTTPQFKYEKEDEEIIGKSDNNLITQSLKKLLSLAKLHCVVTNNITTTTTGTTLITTTTTTTTMIASTVTTTMPSTTIRTAAATTSTCCSDGKNHNPNIQFKKPITNKVIRKNQPYHENIVIEDKCIENETQQPTPDDETFSQTCNNNDNNDTPVVVNLFTQFDIQRLNPLSRNKRRPRSKQWVVERKLVPNQSESKHQIVSMDIVPQEQKTTTTTTTTTESVNESTNNNNNNNNSNFLEQQQQQQSNSGLSTSGLSEILKSTCTGNDDQWMISNDVGDFSLSSLLGRLDYQKTNQSIASNSDTQLSTDVDAQLHTMLIETSIDYTEKFADLAAQVINNKK